MTDPDEDLLGRKQTDDERQLLALYRQLQALSRRQDLPPAALMNVRQAMVLLWNACNDLCLIAEEPGCD